MVVQGTPVMSRASLLKMTMPAVLAAAASPMRMPGTDSVPSRADAFSKSRPADHDGESDHHGNPQALLEQEGGQRHGDDRGRGGQNGAEAYAEQAVGSENGHHGEAETGAGEGHEQVLATADVPGQSLAGDDEDQAHGQRANNEAHEADLEGRQRQRAGNDARRSEHHDGCNEAQKVLHRCDLRAHGKPLLLGAGRGARRLSAPPPSF